MEGFLPAADALRNGEARFANRAVPGVRDYAQIPELAERGKARCLAFLSDLDQQLAGREFVATDFFSAADINAYITVEFAARVGVKPDSAMQNLLRWYRAVGERPSVRALPAPP
jgi:glutathione S-transferase